jgi:hypothetical protein
LDDSNLSVGAAGTAVASRPGPREDQAGLVGVAALGVVEEIWEAEASLAVSPGLREASKRQQFRKMWQ